MKLFYSPKNKKRSPRFRDKQETKNRRRVFSYHAGGEERTTIPKGRERYHSNSPDSTKKMHWHKLPSYFIIASIIVSAGFFLSLDTNPKIVALESRSDSSLLREKQTYQSEAREILNKSLLNRSKITIDSTNFNSQMKLKFPELSEVSVILPLAGRRPIVEVSAKQPALLLEVGGSQLL